MPFENIRLLYRQTLRRYNETVKATFLVQKIAVLNLFTLPDNKKVKN